MANIVVYCSSCSNLAECYLDTAVKVGKWIGENRYSLVYGGVNVGLMHTVAVATHENGGRIVGVIPAVFKHRADTLNDDVFLTDNLSDRKSKMIEMGNLFIVLPGGLGTIDEWITTLSQLTVDDKQKRKIIVVNINGIYNNMLSQLDCTVTSVFAHGDVLSRMVVCDTIEDLSKELSRFSHL